MKKHIFLPDSLKIVLVQLNDKSVYAGYKRNLTKRTPLGLAYIAGSLISAGHSVEIVDAALDDLEVNQIIKTTLDRAPHLVGITATTPLFPQLVDVVKGLKNGNKDIYFVIGGPHVSSLPEVSLVPSEADCVCIGEGEHSIVELIDNLIQNKEPSSVQSIMYRWNGEIKATKTMRMKLWHAKAMPAPPDLDSISFPARQILRLNEYVDYARGVLSPQTSFITSRGCVGRCRFCSAGETFVRFRSIDNVLQELEEIYHRYHIKNLVFYDDSFTVKKERVIKFCKGMVERNLKFNYQVQLRLDQVDEEVMDWLLRSGCEYVGPGIESGNAEILRSIGKSPKATPEFMLEKCNIIKKYPVKLRCSYIMGWIDETEEQIWDTIELAKKIDAHENAFSIATPYPGTRMWEVALKRGLVSNDMDFSKLLYYHKIGCNLSRISDERLLELHELAYQEVGNRTYRLNEHRKRSSSGE
jgi:radical SAM superfamily enzyme YgiQ (UPF0313 family)